MLIIVFMLDMQNYKNSKHKYHNKVPFKIIVFNRVVHDVTMY